MTRVKASGPLVIGESLVGLLVILAVLAPVLTPHDPAAITGPVLGRPSAQHWLGTDVPGRDIFAQLVYGARDAYMYSAKRRPFTRALTG